MGSPSGIQATSTAARYPTTSAAAAHSAIPITFRMLPSAPTTAIPQQILRPAARARTKEVNGLRRVSNGFMDGTSSKDGAPCPRFPCRRDRRKCHGQPALPHRDKRHGAEPTRTASRSARPIRVARVPRDRLPPTASRRSRLSCQANPAHDSGMPNGNRTGGHAFPAQKAPFAFGGLWSLGGAGSPAFRLRAGRESAAKRRGH